jgi:cytochrome b pre-mRNA-processing protein 3
MGLENWFRRRPAQTAGRALYARAAEQARAPAFYTRLGAPDTVEGRFELYALHVVLLLHRLKAEPAAAETAQALFDAFARALDDALREMGVGDTSVGKKMRKLGEAIYGRIRAYDTALAALPDQADLKSVLSRTVLADAAGEVDAVAAYVIGAVEALRGQPTETLLKGQVAWPEPAA